MACGCRTQHTSPVANQQRLICLHHATHPRACLLHRVFAYQWRRLAYSTLYWSINAVPHKITAMVDGASQPDASVQGYRRSYYLRDEQGFNVTFAGGDAIVYGGGVIHAVNQVLQAGDLYPSVTAVLTRNPDSFSYVTNLISDADDLLAPYNISIVSMLETKPGSIALPVNSVCNRW